MGSPPKFKLVSLDRSPLRKLLMNIMLDVEVSGGGKEGIAIAGNLFEMGLKIVLQI
jgi:heterodisulfide reductase subunit A-like polyferredoxin